MKKIMFVSLAFLLAVVGLAPHVFAQGFVPLAPIPGLTDIQPTQGGLANFFNNLYKYLIGLAAALAVIQIIWGGLEIAVNKDNVSKIMDSKGKIYNAIFGLVLVLSPVLVFSIINPSILNLSLNLPELKTAPPAPTPTTSTPYTLPNTDQQLRESSGGTVLYSFLIDLLAVQNAGQTVGQILDAKQDECTATQGGPGIILPVLGGATKYVCQTCPPNTSLVLNQKGGVGATARGSCRVN